MLDPKFALWAVHSADQNGRQVLLRKDHHITSCYFLYLQCAASSSCVPKFLFGFKEVEPCPPWLEN
jgi:hypothetical protein